MAIKIKHFKTRVVRYPALALAGLVAVVMLGFERELSKADWGTWVGAVGTLGTLVGTMWIATTETRRRRRQEVARSLIVASALAPRLKQLADEVGSFHMRLIFGRTQPGGLGHPTSVAANFLAIKYTEATTEELIALEILPKNCATKLAYAQGQLASVRSQVERYVAASNGSNSLLTDMTYHRWQDWAADLSGRFDVLARQCADAANTHAAPPTAVELYGEPSDYDEL